MLEFSNLALIGRVAVPGADDRWLREKYEELTEQMAIPYLREHTDRVEAWNDHNVFAAVGPWGKWHRFEWQTWEGLGKVATPHLGAVVRYDLVLGVTYPVPPDTVDPPVLHHAYELFGGPGPRQEDTRSKMMMLYKDLERRGLIDWPGSGTRRGWEAILRRENIRIEGFKVVPREDGPDRAHAA